MKLLFLGTSSDAGKTLMSALFCRYLTKMGLDTVPFKASNLSHYSVMTTDGGKIGIGQAFQAAACEKEPNKDMNPVLLRPSGKGTIHLIIKGEYGGISSATDTDRLSGIAYEAYDRLSKEHEAIICEGSGSPVELNRMSKDYSNIRLMREKNIPAVIVGDIERGGVFAAIYGTWSLIEEKDRKNLKGFIINRFRGDPQLLKSGIETIESLTGMECLGVVPYFDMGFPKEDGLSAPGCEATKASVRGVHIENLDKMLDLVKGSLDLEKLRHISSV